MKNTAFLLLLSCCLSCQQITEKHDIIIENITIIDVENSTLIPDRTIYVNHGRIEEIKQAKVGDEVLAHTKINGKGKYILPGFWDMHVHTSWKKGLDTTTLPIFLKFGITGIRDMGGKLRLLNTFKNRAKNQPSNYPNLFGAGPILDGDKPIHPEFSIAITTANYRQKLDSLIGGNVDFFKVYSLMKDDVLDSIASYSKKNKINFSGHISEYITPENASRLGYKSFEHLNRLEELANDSIRLQHFVELVKENENWLCPTLIIYQRKHEIKKGEYFYHPLFEDLDKDLLFEWENSKQRAAGDNSEEIKKSNERLKLQKELVKSFHDNQVPLLLGTDFAGMPFVYPGYSFHEEMKLMQEIGITNFDILRMATLNPPIYLGVSDEYGTVEKNKIADLVILNANPLDDIGNTLSIDFVIKSGELVTD